MGDFLFRGGCFVGDHGVEEPDHTTHPQHNSEGKHLVDEEEDGPSVGEGVVDGF